MSNSRPNSRLVFSTDSGRICPDCGQAKAGCLCQKKKKKAASQGGHKVDGIIRIQRETKGRKGKAVTAIYGFDPVTDDLKQIATQLKRRCGTGGAVKNGVIIIQGDHRNTIRDELTAKGHVVKLSGGG